MLVAAVGLIAAPDAWSSETRPDWSVGDSWTYRSTSLANAAYKGTVTSDYTVTVTVSAVGANSYTVERRNVGNGPATRPTRQRWSRDLNYLGRKPTGHGLQELSWLRWPLVEGNSWDFPWTGATSDDLTGVWYAPRVERWVRYNRTTYVRNFLVENRTEELLTPDIRGAGR